MRPLPVATMVRFEGIVGRCEMTFLPLWMEILLNVIGYAGFVGIATWHKSSEEITRDSPLRGHSSR